MNQQDIRVPQEEDVLDCVMRLARVMRRHPRHDKSPKRELPFLTMRQPKQEEEQPRSPRGRFTAMRILELVHQLETPTAGELSEALDLRPSSLTEALDRLEEQQMIVRKRDTNDSRSVHISISEQGEKRLAEIKEKRAKASQEFSAVLSEEEKKQFCAIANKLIQAQQAKETETKDE